MEKNANYALVGASALLLAIGLAIFVVWMARLQFNRDYDVYDILFQGPVRGLSVGAEVHFNGIKVGDVTKIALDRTNPARVIARARVTSDVPIRTDSYATLEPQGITGVNYVQITAGTAAKPLLKDASPRGEIPVIRSQRSALSDLLEGGGTVLTRTIEALDRVNRVLSDQNIKNFSAAVSDAQAITAEARERKSIIADSQKAVQDLDATARQLTKLTADADQMMNGDGRRALKNAADATEQAKETVARANALLAKLEGPTNDFAASGLPEVSTAMIELENATQSLNRLLGDLQANPAGAFTRPPGEEIEVKP